MTGLGSMKLVAPEATVTMLLADAISIRPLWFKPVIVPLMVYVALPAPPLLLLL